MTQNKLRYGIVGAGSIGCYLGGQLIRAGHTDVILCGRASLAEEIRAHGLRITNHEGVDERIPADAVRVVTSARDLARCDVVFVTVKSRDTAAAAHELRGVLAAGATLVSFQNGVRNAEVIRAVLPEQTVLAGMVPFNVVRNPGAHFHCGTTGNLMIADGLPVADQIVADLCAAGLPAAVHPNLTGVLWGKLVFNLNNAINALAGVPLREELSQRAYRRIVAASIREALRVMRTAGVRPVRAGRMIPWLAPYILGLPDALFFRVAAPMVKIDPEARSSMWEDLERRRPTEIDFITGEVVELARRAGTSAPLAEHIVARIKAAEAAGTGSPRLSARELAGVVGIS